MGELAPVQASMLLLLLVPVRSRLGLFEAELRGLPAGPMWALRTPVSSHGLNPEVNKPHLMVLPPIIGYQFTPVRFRLPERFPETLLSCQV